MKKQATSLREELSMKTKLGAIVVFVLVQLVGSHCVHAGGLVAAWGDSSYGQTTLPAGVNSVKAIALGPEHGLALRSDGTVVAWGHDYDGDTRVPPRSEEHTSELQSRHYLVCR